MWGDEYASEAEIMFSAVPGSGFRVWGGGLRASGLLGWGFRGFDPGFCGVSGGCLTFEASWVAADGVGFGLVGFPGLGFKIGDEPRA